VRKALVKRVFGETFHKRHPQLRPALPRNAPVALLFRPSSYIATASQPGVI